MSRPASTDATPRQLQILDWITSYINAHDLSPTVRDIGNAFGIKSSSTFELLIQLERKGYIERLGLGARALVVKDQALRSCVDVPVVGRIAAGGPVEAIEHDAGTLRVNEELLRGRDGFALKVLGTSMIEAGIEDGAFVIIRQQDTAEDGDIVVALIGSEATLKRFYRDGDGVRLEPANSTMQPIHVRSGEFRIQGKLVDVRLSLDNCT